MSQNVYEPVNKTIDVLKNITSSVKFPVDKGAMHTIYETVQASSASSSGVKYQLTVSDGQVVDTVVELSNQIAFGVSGTSTTTPYLYNFGVDTCFSDYPLMSCMQTLTLTLDSSPISTEIGENFDLIKELFDDDFVKRSQNYCPTQRDIFFNPSSCANTPNDVFSTGTIASFEKSRGAYFYDLAPAACRSAAMVAGTQLEATITVTLKELLNLKPFLSKKYGGLSGIRTFSLSYTFVPPSACCAIRNRNALIDTAKFTITSITPTMANCSMKVKLLTPFPSFQLPSRSIRTYNNYNRSTVSGAVPAIGVGAISTKINFVNQKLEVVPSLIAFAVRPQKSAKTPQMSDSYLPIQSLSITLGTTQNLLASASFSDLYQLRRDSGASHNNWLVYSGFSLGNEGLQYNVPAVAAGAATPALTQALISPSTPSLISMCGNVLLIKTCFMELSDYMAGGQVSSGLNFSGALTVLNNTGAIIAAANNYEVVSWAVSEGLIASEAGQTVVAPSVLSKDDVLKVSHESFTNLNVASLEGGKSWIDEREANMSGKGMGYSRGMMASGKKSTAFSKLKF